VQLEISDYGVHAALPFVHALVDMNMHIENEIPLFRNRMIHRKSFPEMGKLA
jgi:hypothetical protein